MKRAILALVMVLAATLPGVAQNYPNKPVRILVAFTPGGAVDITARIVAQKLTEVWGQQVIVENRPGGGGTIAVNAVAQAPADGYTLLVAANAEIAANPVLFPNAAIDPTKDLSPITLISMTPFLLVSSLNSGINTYEDLIKEAKERPNQITWSSAGTGSTNHFVGAWFAASAGIKMRHVPYRGAAPAAAAMAGGETMVGVVSPTAGLPFIRSGKIKMLALTTKYKPAFAKDWPSVAEKGLPNFDAGAWMGLFAPANTPPEIVAKLNAGVIQLLKEPDVQKRLSDLGLEPIGTTTPEFVERLKADLDLYKRIAQEAEIRPQ